MSAVVLFQKLVVQVGDFLQRNSDVHVDFRLWITTEAHTLFPMSLLHLGIKLTTEAPVGIRASLRSSFQLLPQVV